MLLGSGDLSALQNVQTRWGHETNHHHLVPGLRIGAFVGCTATTLPSFIVTKADILRPFILPAVIAMVTLQHNFAAPIVLVMYLMTVAKICTISEI
jgi:hypothetical protein